MTEYRIAGPRVDQRADDSNLLYHLSTLNPKWEIRLARYDFDLHPEGAEVVIFRGTVRQAIERIGSL